MPKKRYMPEEIIQHLRTVELETGKGLAVFDACQNDTYLENAVVE
jgi:putative transposase